MGRGAARLRPVKRNRLLLGAGANTRQGLAVCPIAAGVSVVNQLFAFGWPTAASRGAGPVFPRARTHARARSRLHAPAYKAAACCRRLPVTRSGRAPSKVLSGEYQQTNSGGAFFSAERERTELAGSARGRPWGFPCFCCAQCGLGPTEMRGLDSRAVR